MENQPCHGDLRLRLETKKKDSAKITYRVQRFVKDGYYVRGSWRITLCRLEWFPRLRTWRLIVTSGEKTQTGTTHWRQTVLADMGDIPETEACSVAIPTLLLTSAGLGY